MTQVEQLILKLGVDTRAVASGLRSVRQQVSSFASSVGGQLSTLIGSGVLYAQFAKVADMAERIRNNAEAWAVSSKFVQDINNVARAAGIGEEKVQSLMDKFVKGLPAGADVEKSFFAMADRLAAIPDPAERARVAFEAFGKSGMDVIRIAGGGSVALRELAKSYNTLTDAQLKQADEAKQNIEDAETNLTVFVGNTIGMLAKAYAAWGKMSAATGTKQAWEYLLEIANEDKIVKADVEGVEKRREAARFASAQRLAEYQKAMAEAQVTQTKKAAEAQKAADKMRQDAAQKYWDFAWKMADKMTSLVRKQRDLQKSFAEAESGRTEMTLGEIAGLDPSQLSRNNRWKIGAAQDVEWMREEAKFARLQGNDQYAKSLISRSDELAQSIGGLAAADADPLKGMKEDAAETAQAIKELNEQAKNEGIRIIPTNGK